RRQRGSSSGGQATAPCEVGPEAAWLLEFWLLGDREPQLAHARVGAGVEDHHQGAVAGLWVADDHQAVYVGGFFAERAEREAEILLAKDLFVFQPDRVVALDGNGHEPWVVGSRGCLHSVG